ncbi:MAG: tRNA (adenosine(37)-N6)-threonylcarbamoyltransferase complex ATPase subunit type 1 TsaE [Candidatus Corynebacterium faecigallinarum]|uniref:tRNA (adenosine(37)-N6)-threonylcarbamoyltransferase complex ATPase subunit type 1 TsaE n=1 Tax=Candidatus Corynebacterium faecigallinarum TaxID=2838528 RepID=UPI003FB65FB9
MTDEVARPCQAFVAPSGECRLDSAEEMRAAGESLGGLLTAGDVVVLTGALGAGKTTLTQGIATGLGVRGRTQSPTFTIVREHKAGVPGRPGLLHMDAYRLLGEGVHDAAELPRELVLDTLESLDLDADLADRVLVAEWGRGVVESLATAGSRVLDVDIDRGAGLDTEITPEEEPRVLQWRWSQA